MGNKHKYYDVIVAWANGEKIQSNDSRFAPYQLDYEEYGVPDFEDNNLTWRIKPKTITKRYRMALHSDDFVEAYDVTNTSIDDPIEYNIKGFVSWLGEAVDPPIVTGKQIGRAHV